MKSVFISYKSEDIQYALRLCRYFSWSDIKYWIDKENIDGGEPYDVIIPEIIQQCDIVLALISKGSLESDNVANEIRIAIKYKKKVIPVMLENIKLEGPISYHIESNNRIEVFKDWDSEVDRLINQLKYGSDKVRSAIQKDTQERTYGRIQPEARDEYTEEKNSISVKCPHCRSTMLKESESLWNAYIVDKRFALMSELIIWLLTGCIIYYMPGSDTYMSEYIMHIKAETTEPVMLQLLEIEPIAKAITLVVMGFIPVIFLAIAREIGRRKMKESNTEMLTFHCVQCDRRFSMSIPKGNRDAYYVKDLVKATAPDRIQRFITNIKKF